MLKLAILLSLFAFVACEGDVAPSDSTNGVIQYVEAPLAQDDAARLRAVCNALSNKEDQLSVLISSQYNFQYQFKGCGESGYSKDEAMTATIERPYGNYIFMRTNGDSFPFPDVETPSVGLLAKFCAQGNGDIVSPIRTSDTSAMWVTTATRAERCNAGSDAYCVHIQRGSLVNGSSYRIHTNEYMKVKLSAPRRGFFLERLQISTAACGNGQAVEKKIVLK